MNNLDTESVRRLVIERAETATASELLLLQQHTVVSSNSMGWVKEFWAEVAKEGGDDYPTYDEVGYLEEKRLGIDDGRALRVGNIETTAMSKKGEVWWSNDHEKFLQCIVKYPGKEQVVIRHSTMPVPAMKEERKGFARLSAFIIGLFQIDQGELVMNFNRSKMRNAAFDSLNMVGILSFHNYLQKNMIQWGYCGNTKPTRKGDAFIDVVTTMLSSISIADYEAINQYVLHKCLTKRGIYIDNHGVRTPEGQMPYLALQREHKLTRENIATLKKINCFPLLHLCGPIGISYVAPASSGSLESAIVASVDSLALRGSPDSGTSRLYSGVGFTGLPPTNIREMLTLIGVTMSIDLKSLDRPVLGKTTYFKDDKDLWMTKDMDPTYVKVDSAPENIKVLTLVAERHVQFVGVPVWMIPFIAESLKCKGWTTRFVVIGAERMKVPKGFTANIITKLDPMHVVVYYVAHVLQMNLTSMSTNWDELQKAMAIRPYRAIVVGRQLPVVSRQIRVFREPHDFYAISSTMPLSKFGEVEYQEIAYDKFYDAVVAACRVVTTYFLAPTVHRNFALSNALKCPDIPVLFREGAIGEWQRDDMELTATEIQDSGGYQNRYMDSDDMRDGSEFQRSGANVRTDADSQLTSFTFTQKNEVEVPKYDGPVKDSM